MPIKITQMKHNYKVTQNHQCTHTQQKFKTVIRKCTHTHTHTHTEEKEKEKKKGECYKCDSNKTSSLVRNKNNAKLIL